MSLHVLLSLASEIPSSGNEGIIGVVVGGVAVSVLVGLGRLIFGTDKRTAVDKAELTGTAAVDRAELTGQFQVQRVELAGRIGAIEDKFKEFQETRKSEREERKEEHEEVVKRLDTILSLQMQHTSDVKLHNAKINTLEGEIDRLRSEISKIRDGRK